MVLFYVVGGGKGLRGGVTMGRPRRFSTVSAAYYTSPLLLYFLQGFIHFQTLR